LTYFDLLLPLCALETQLHIGHDYIADALFIKRLSGLSNDMLQGLAEATSGGDGAPKAETLDFPKLSRLAEQVGEGAKDFIARLEKDFVAWNEIKADSGGSDDHIPNDQEEAEAAMMLKLSREFVSVLQRGIQDVDDNGISQEDAARPELLSMSLQKLEVISAWLERLKEGEGASVAGSIDEVLSLANGSAAPGGGNQDTTNADIATLLQQMRQSLRMCPQLGFEEIVETYLLQDQPKVLQRVNPLLGIINSGEADAGHATQQPAVDDALAKEKLYVLNERISSAMFRCVRREQINRCAIDLADLRSHIETLISQLLTRWASSDASLAGTPSRELLQYVNKKCMGHTRNAAAELVALQQLRMNLLALARREVLPPPKEAKGVQGTQQTGAREEHTLLLEQVVTVALHLGRYSAARARRVLLTHTSAEWQQILHLARRRCTYYGRQLPQLQSVSQAGPRRLVLSLTSGPAASAKSSESDSQGMLVALVNAVKNTASSLSGQMQTKRAFIPLSTVKKLQTKKQTASAFQFDPRILAFEFITTFMVRQMQLDLIREFIDKAEGLGQSFVEQMIMGGGKTR
jgi:hypothetical protein